MQPEHFASLPALIASQKPSEAHLCFCPAHVHRQVAKFHESFPGSTAWAVKANPHPVVLRAIIDAGIREFDVASRQEIDLVRAALPAAVLHFNNPVKAPEDIAHALAAGVRSFALDCQEELEKIAALAAGAGVPARNILLNVRFKDAAARGTDNYNFHEKFGAAPDEASHLLQHAKELGFRAGLTFHPGSQNRNPAAYEEMMRLAHAIAGRALGPDMAGLDLLNVGGGFPCHYPGGGEQPLTHYFDSVRRGAALFPCPISCEPGRALVADSISLLARINLRRSGDNRLYINDGIYGSFMELPFVDFHPPARAYSPGGTQVPEEAVQLFHIWGATCDSLDKIPTPVRLPASIQTGSYIEFGLMGAYTNATATHFNGIAPPRLVTVERLDAWEGKPGERRSAS